MNAAEPQPAAASRASQAPQAAGQPAAAPQADQAPQAGQPAPAAPAAPAPHEPHACEPFGARVAQQTGAFMEEDRPTARIDHLGERPAQVDWRQKLATMGFDERVDATLESLKRRSTFRDILYGLLGFCEQEQPYEAIEPYVEGFLEFHRNRQSPRRYVQMLLRTGALEEIELGEDGQPLTEEAKQAAIENGLDPEDLDTLVFDWRVVTTDAGRAARERFKPGSRMAQLLDADPERAEALLSVMEFCLEPRTMGQIADAFAGKAFLGIDEETRLPRQPSAYIEKLDRAGAVAWDGERWSTTEEGTQFLQERLA